MAEHREILLLNKTEGGIRYMFVLAYIEQIFDSPTSKFPTPHQITHLLKIFPPDIAYIGTEEKIQRAILCGEVHVKVVCNEKRGGQRESSCS